MVAEDEQRRCGHWQRLFPCDAPSMHRYLAYFEFARYSNLVLCKWMERPDWALLLSMLKTAILGGLQLATTAFSEGDTGLRAALHTPEEPPSHRARSQRLWCPL